MRVVFGEWLPDQQDLDHGGLEDAVNTIPYATGYGPFPSSQPLTSSLSATVRGAISTQALDGSVYTFAGTAGQMYRVSGTGWSNVSRVTTSYAVATDSRWQFAEFGNTVLAVNGTDAMQVYTMGTSTVFNDQSASASAPVAKYISTVRDFVMVGNITGGADNQNRVQWSRINNPLRWDVNVRFQSDYQDLPGSGAVTGLTGGDFAAILTEHSIWRATYLGSPVVFRFDEVAPGIGCSMPGSVARFQNMTFFYSRSGFYSFDGDQAAPIGFEKVDEFFKSDLDSAYIDKVWSTVDPINKLYIILYANRQSSGTNNRMLVYNWSVGRWARIEHDATVIFNALTGGYTLEQLDSFGTMETLPFSLDSDVWKGGLTILSEIDTGHRLGTFDSSAKAARWITGEAQLVQDGRAFVRAIRPLVQGTSATTVTARIGQRDTLLQSVSYGTASTMNTTGVCPVRSNARFQRVRVDASGGFTRARGFDADLTSDGTR